MQPATVAALVTAMAALNVGAALVAAADKRASRRGGQRVPEPAFHALALLGAWPGLAWAFHGLRHKTRKVRFLVLFWLAAAANAALVVVLWHGSR